MGFSKQAIDNLLCRWKKPNPREWQVYYLKQTQPRLTIEQIYTMLGMSHRKVSDALKMFKIHQGKPVRFGWENIERVIQFIEKEPEIERERSLLYLMEAINYCPYWPDWEDEKIVEFLMDIEDDFLSPELQVLKYTLSFLYESMDKEFLLEKFLEFRILFDERGLRLLYWMATVPYAALAMAWNARFTEEEHTELIKNSPHLPYFYRQLYMEIHPMIKFMKRDVFRTPLPSIIDEKDGKVSAFFKNITTGKYKEALQLDFSDEVIPDSLRRMTTFIRLSLSIILSKEPPRELPSIPGKNFEYEGFFSQLNYYLVRLLMARLRGEDPHSAIEDAPEEVYFTIKSLYIDHDRDSIKGVGWYAVKLIRMMLDGEVEKAWEIARTQKLMYDFHINYILLGFPLFDLLTRYKLRIGWYPIGVSFEGKHAYIHYAGGRFRIPPAPSYLLKEVMGGKGYMSRKQYRNFRKHLWFLHIKKRDYGESILVELDEELNMV